MERARLRKTGGGEAGKGPPCHAVASIVVPKRPGGDPPRPAASGDQKRAGGERLLAASWERRRAPRRDEPREGRRQRPRAFTSATGKHGEAPGEGQGGGWGSADELRDKGALSVAAGEAGIFVFFFVFLDFCDGSTLFVCSEKLAMFGVKVSLYTVAFCF